MLCFTLIYQEIAPYDTLKIIFDIAAPFVTIFSAMLGVLTETKEEYIFLKDGKEQTGKRLTDWAYYSIAGIIIGGLLSICSILTDKKVNSISGDNAKETKKEQDSTYNANVDSIFKLSDRLNTGINETSKNTSTIIGKSMILAQASENTLFKLDKSYEKQEEINQRNNLVLDQNIQMLNPLFPLQIEIDFSLALPKDEMGLLKHYFDSLRPLIDNNLPKYFSLGFDDYHFSFHQVPDTISTYNSAFRSLQNHIEQEIIPSYYINIYRDSINVKNVLDYNKENCKIDIIYPFPNTNVASYASKFQLYYTVDTKNNKISGSIRITDPTKENIRSHKIGSFYAIPKGTIVIGEYYRRSDGINTIKNITFNCGYNYYDRYTIYLDEQNRFNLPDRRGYAFRTKDLERN